MRDEEDLPGGERGFDAVVERYVEEVTRLAGGVVSGDDDWAMERLDELLHQRRPREVWAILGAAIGRIDDERVLCQVGAGVLETLIEIHGPALIADVEAAIATDARFRMAVCCIWIRDTPIRDRIAAGLEAAGVGVQDPDRPDQQ
ncbi:MAG TPA: hypothetical protein VFU19_13160 [Iamia sp.]|nr:hypothetical protein [Iamia sp.]